MAQPLQLALTACDVALESINAKIADSEDNDLQVIRTDFISLLSLIYAASTKLALALKPSSPTPTAAVAPLKDISNHVTALSHCARLLGPKYGSALTQEFVSAAKDVIISVKALVQVFIEIEAKPSIVSSGKAGDQYLVRTGAVHDIINSVKSNLSQDNVAAVRKKLLQDHASLDDGLQEVDGMITDQASIGDTSSDDWEDDGWAELGIDSKARMTTEELERTKKAHVILRLSTILHKRIIKDILTRTHGSDAQLSLHSLKNLDALPHQSSTLAIASDEFVSTLYTPQTPSEISKELAAYVAAISSFRSIILELFQAPTLTDQLQAMSLQQTPGTPPKDLRKWFEMCFIQIQKAASNLDSTLNADNTDG
ncbi:hypothetical protein H0H92_010926 [Tricholoma furcatifolium]|nr:hypothetical protein H0H92_010926 [Tricholoma furcatifolium]